MKTKFLLFSAMLLTCGSLWAQDWLSNGSNAYNNSNVGIGPVFNGSTEPPTETLDVDGTVRIRSLSTVGMQQNDNLSRILVADDNGVLYWRNAPSISQNNYASFPASAGDSDSQTNSFFGDDAGQNIMFTQGINNTFIGSQSGFSNATGNRNTFIGRRSGYNAVGSGNVFLGYHAGYNEAGNNLLYIDNSNTDAPLIWGDFNADMLRFNGNVEIGGVTPGNLSVSGASTFNNTATFTQDASFGAATDFGGMSTFNGGATFSSAAIFDDTSTFNGIADFNNTATFDGTGTFNSDVIIGNDAADNLTVNAAAAFQDELTVGTDNADVLTVNSTSTFMNPSTFQETGIFNDDLTIGNEATDNLTVNGISAFAGNVGIGVPAPGAGLHVNGTVRLEVDPGDGTYNRVLASDNQGNVRWRDEVTLDDQDLSVVIADNDRTINITNGTSANFSVDDGDSDDQNEYNTGASLSGTTLNVTDSGGDVSVDLDPTFATNAQLAALNIDDADHIIGNEYNTGASLSGTTLNVTDSGGDVSVDLGPTFATDTELAALNIDDADHIIGNEYNTGASLSGTTLNVTDSGGDVSVDLGPTFATDAELAALNIDDADHIIGNEYNTGASLSGTALNVTDSGGDVSVDLGPTFATDAELAALNSATHTFPSFPDSAGDNGGFTSSYFGYEAGALNMVVGGHNNTFMGYRSGYNITGGSYNTANGSSALLNNTIGSRNTANGFRALYDNTAAGGNIAIGYNALRTQSFDNGGTAWSSYNVAIGYEALYSNQPINTISGRRNIAIGYRAMYNNTTGVVNTAIGYEALYSITTAQQNTAVGYRALRNTTAWENTAVGYNALDDNTSGNLNTAIGHVALSNNTIGAGNTASGRSALGLNTTGDNNTAIGYSSGPNNGGFSNTTALGYDATPTASNRIRVGNNAVTRIGGIVGWSNLSDGRFKKNVEENIPGLAFISQLRPVSYELDKPKLQKFLKKESPEGEKTAEPNPDSYRDQRRSIGFVAQEVEDVLQAKGYTQIGIEAPQNEGDHYSIRYAEFVVPLVKAVQELSTKDEAQQEIIEALQQQNQALQQEIESIKNTISGTTGGFPTDNQAKDATGFALYQNVPNPFDKTTTIEAVIPEGIQQAKIIVYNLQGLELESYPISGRGNTTVEISAGRFPSGMYLYALMADGQLIDAKKMILTR